ncbi:MAG: metallophosphoesterase [Acidobacteriota bacterium]|nr:metallophosphoesterase [Acidobacteriota bacterium]
MRKPEMILFLAVALGIYGLINLYVFHRGWQALEGFPRVRLVFAVLLGFLILSFPASRFLASASDNHGRFAGPAIWIGSLYLALMLYLLLLTAAADLVRLLNSFLGFFPGVVTGQPQKAGFFTAVGIFGAALLIVIAGYLNSLNPRSRILEVRIGKAAGPRKGLNIVMASDIHLGIIIGSARLEKLVRQINHLHPDLVCLPGDIVDESVYPAEEERMIATLKKIRAPLGVFSVPGNHEYFSGLEKNVEYLRRGGVRVLQDEVVEVDKSFYLGGRKDPTVLRRGEGRLPTKVILEEGRVDLSRPVILLDHQPLNLSEAEGAGIDLQLSGHTHAGQLFPLNLVNKAVYEKNWGYHRRGRTQFYISCGAGTWGPPVRTGSIPEIVLIKITFEPPPPAERVQ